MSKYTPLANEDHYLEGEQYVLDECRKCGLIYQRRLDRCIRPEHDTNWVEWDGGLEVSKNNRGVDYFARHADWLLDVLRYMGQSPYKLTVFDFAFGWGHWCRLVKGFGCEVLYGSELRRTNGLNVHPKLA